MDLTNNNGAENQATEKNPNRSIVLQPSKKSRFTGAAENIPTGSHFNLKPPMAKTAAAARGKPMTPTFWNVAEIPKTRKRALSKRLERAPAVELILYILLCKYFFY